MYFCKMSGNEKNKQKNILQKLNIKKKEVSSSLPPSKPKIKLSSKKSLNSSSTNFELVATCMQNLENELATEIKNIGGSKIKIQKRAVRFEGNLEILYKANIWLR